MKRDVILAGVGGQGVLSVGAIISSAAVEEGLEVRQSEVHGMAQRGGAVLAHLRISDKAIASDLVPRGAADLILAMEPLEALRYANWLSAKLESGEPGAMVSAAEPLVNIPNYPDIAGIIELLKSFPLCRIVQAASLAKEAGLAQSVNMVMVGAASPFLPIKTETLEATIKKMFSGKGADKVEANLKAFALGMNAVK
ncbi:MAG: indolepyruvate oxidoreductase subunit beta [Treponema sp.]|nr:indolepyruvate oxidoreductase subunit beta [Treponema sp.]